MFNQLFPNVDWVKLWEATYETLYMTVISTGVTFVLGLAIGILLFLTRPDPNKANTQESYL